MNTEIITRYIGQPTSLPSELRRRIEREWGGQPVQLYELADLDHAIRHMLRQDPQRNQL